MAKANTKLSGNTAKYEADKVDVEVGLANGLSLRQLVPLRYRKVVKKCLKSVVFVIAFWGIASIFLFRYLQGQTDTAYINSIWAGWVIVLLSGLVWSMGAQMMYYMRYFYDIDDRTVIIRKGIIAQSEITLPLSKITDVYVNQDLLDVLFGLYDVHISTPTQSSGDFAHLDGLDKRGAYLIRSIVLERIHKEDEISEES